MKLPISEDTKAAIYAALLAEYFEGAVEAVFAEHPEATRDDAVDTVEGLTMMDTITALEACRLRRLAGKPLAEVDRLWRLESLDGKEPGREVRWEAVGAPVDYRELELREQAANLPWPPPKNSGLK